MPPRVPNPLVPPAAVLEYIKEPLFDAAVIPTTWNTEVRFFVNHKGQAMQNATAAYFKSGTETNMVAPGKLPLPQVASIHSYRFVVSQLSDVDDALKFLSTVVTNPTALPNALWNDFMRIWYGSYLEFEVSQKPYMQRPTWMVPSATHLGGVMDVGVGESGGAGDYAYQTAIAPSMDGPVRDLSPHRIYLYPEQHFGAKIVPRPAGYTQSVALKVWFILEAAKGRETL